MDLLIRIQVALKTGNIELAERLIALAIEIEREIK